MDQAMGIILTGLFLGILVGLPVALFVISRKTEEDEFVANHRKIRPGMTKISVVSILGNNYTQSYLKDGTEKLEWRFRNAGYTGRVAKGLYMHTGSLTRRISVYVKGGRVVEVKSLNMD